MALTPGEIASSMDLILEEPGYNENVGQQADLQGLYEQLKKSFLQTQNLVVQYRQVISRGQDQTIPPSALTVLQQSADSMIQAMSGVQNTLGFLKPERAIRKATTPPPLPARTPPPLPQRAIPVNQPAPQAPKPPPIPQAAGRGGGLMDRLKQAKALAGRARPAIQPPTLNASQIGQSADNVKPQANPEEENQEDFDARIAQLIHDWELDQLDEESQGDFDARTARSAHT